MSDATRLDSWTHGPDMLHPAESYLTTDLSGAVKLRKTDNNNHPLSIYTKFKRTVELGPNQIALGLFSTHKNFTFRKSKLEYYFFLFAVTEENGVWTTITYAKYWELCMQAAKSFIKVQHLSIFSSCQFFFRFNSSFWLIFVKFGLEPSHCVAIMGFNAPAWVISMFGAIFTGYEPNKLKKRNGHISRQIICDNWSAYIYSGISCGIYTTNSADACEHILRNCGARIVVVENQIHLDKILKCLQTCRIDKIVQYTGTVQNSHNGLIFTVSVLMFLIIKSQLSLNETFLSEKVERVSRIWPNNHRHWSRSTC